MRVKGRGEDKRWQQRRRHRLIDCRGESQVFNVDDLTAWYYEENCVIC